MTIDDQIKENVNAYIVKTGHGYPDIMYLGRQDMATLKAYLHSFADTDLLVTGGGLADRRIEFRGMIVIPCATACYIGFGHKYND